MSAPIYELKELTKKYGEGGAEVVALSGVTLTIAPSEFVVIAGPSGSGKSTLLQLLGALDRPTSGAILFEGRDLDHVRDGELARLRLRAFGFIFQQFNLIPTLTAQQNVEAALAPVRGASGDRQARAESLLAQVGLASRKRHLPTELSGGEQQRVAIARALANEPRVLLADEPTGNLDSATGEEVLGLLRRLSDEHGQTVVLITHDQAIAEDAPRVVRLRDGALVPEVGVPVHRGAAAAEGLRGTSNA